MIGTSTKTIKVSFQFKYSSQAIKLRTMRLSLIATVTTLVAAIVTLPTSKTIFEISKPEASRWKFSAGKRIIFENISLRRSISILLANQFIA